MSETKDYIKALFKESQTACIELIGKCQSCNTEVAISIFSSGGDVYGNGGMAYRSPGPPIFKCYECLERDDNMIHPQRCEVFSRVCGYLRPVSHFNLGKKEEFKTRTNFKMQGE